MGLFSSIAKEVGRSIQKQYTDTVIKTTGADIKPELREIDYEIKELERELTDLEYDKDKYEKSEYMEIVADIKSEIRVYKRLKLDLLNDMLEDYREERKAAYREQLNGVSEKRLRRIADNYNAPKILREVAREKLGQ